MAFSHAVIPVERVRSSVRLFYIYICASIMLMNGAMDDKKLTESSSVAYSIDFIHSYALLNLCSLLRGRSYIVVIVRDMQSLACGATDPPRRVLAMSD